MSANCWARRGFMRVTKHHTSSLQPITIFSVSNRNISIVSAPSVVNLLPLLTLFVLFIVTLAIEIGMRHGISWPQPQFEGMTTITQISTSIFGRESDCGFDDVACSDSKSQHALWVTLMCLNTIKLMVHILKCASLKGDIFPIQSSNRTAQLYYT